MLDKKIFAERLKAKRHEKLLSQNQLAKIIHVATSAISTHISFLKRCVILISAV